MMERDAEEDWQEGVSFLLVGRHEWASHKRL
jgi:hypothetical protein